MLESKSGKKKKPEKKRDKTGEAINGIAHRTRSMKRKKVCRKKEKKNARVSSSFESPAGTFPAAMNVSDCPCINLFVYTVLNQ